MSVCVNSIECNAECLCKLVDSRAHTIVTLAFTQNRRRENTSMQSTINLVDLAGRSRQFMILTIQPVIYKIMLLYTVTDILKAATKVLLKYY